MSEFLNKHTELLVVTGLILTCITIQISLYNGLRTDLQATNTRIDHLADNMSKNMSELSQRLAIVETKLDSISSLPSESD